MKPSLKEDIFQKMVAIETLIQKVLQAVDTPNEGPLRSLTNEQVAYQMGEFGVMVAGVENLAQVKHDHLGQVKEEQKLKWMGKSDSTTGKHYSATKAESLASLEPEVRELEQESQALNHSVNVLTRKTKSFWAWLENSRSRLSFIGREMRS